MAMSLNNLHPAPGSRKKSRRLGRGHGSGRVKTAGRGTKGQKARAGGGVPPYFKGGQGMFVAGLPVKRGLHNKRPPRERPETVNVAELARFPAGSIVNRDTLVEAKLIEPRTREVKILGEGTLPHRLIVVADQFSAGAKAKIEAAGGEIVVVGAPAAEGS